MNFFGWKTWNDRLSIFILAAIMSIWVLDGRHWIDLKDSVSGALVVVFTMVASFYFRKAPSPPTLAATVPPVPPSPAPIPPTPPAPPPAPPGG